MLFAVEGGGFFSSSASGYSKGLTLLLLGQNQEDTPMRVSPWSQYQLVDQEPDSDLQLASVKNRLPRGCASFVCFGRASADSPRHLKVGPAQQQDLLPDTVAVDKGKDHATEFEDDNNLRKATLKSSLKKPPKNIRLPVEYASQSEALGEKGGDICGHTERRKVQWTDVSGSELAEIREFEPSFLCKWWIISFAAVTEMRTHQMAVKEVCQMMNPGLEVKDAAHVRLCDPISPYSELSFLEVQ